MFTEDMTSLVIMQVKGVASSNWSLIVVSGSESVSGCWTMDSIAWVKAVAGIIEELSVCFTCNLAIRCFKQCFVFCLSEHLVQVPISGVLDSTLPLHDTHELYDIKLATPTTSYVCLGGYRCRSSESSTWVLPVSTSGAGNMLAFSLG